MKMLEIVPVASSPVLRFGAGMWCGFVDFTGCGLLKSWGLRLTLAQGVRT